MGNEELNPVSFVDMVLILLESRFPWLGNASQEAVSRADTVEALVDLHSSLLRQPTAWSSLAIAAARSTFCDLLISSARMIWAHPSQLFARMGQLVLSMNILWEFVDKFSSHDPVKITGAGMQGWPQP